MSLKNFICRPCHFKSLFLDNFYFTIPFINNEENKDMIRDVFFMKLALYTASVTGWPQKIPIESLKILTLNSPSELFSILALFVLFTINLKSHLSLKKWNWLVNIFARSFFITSTMVLIVHTVIKHHLTALQKTTITKSIVVDFPFWAHFVNVVQNRLLC